jgi:hypothetical protein
MSDRELLELAAKAAGIDAQWDCPERGMMMLTPSGIDTMSWNPLTDDGDALRLAVKLGLLGAPFMTLEFIAAMGDSAPYADIRRAIVRAAAEIGRNMT